MIVLVVTALLPVFAILAYVYFTDPDKEPWQTLLTAFGLGALTIVPAALCEGFLFDIFNAKNYPLVENFFCIGLTEEFFKLTVIMLYIFRHRDFNDTFDGIVYAVAASLGFAAAENVIYTLENGFDTGILRAFTSVPGHAAFAVFMGGFVSTAKTHHFYLRTKKRTKYILLALFVPTVVHGLYDYLLTIKQVELFFLLIIVIDIAAIIIIRRARKNDKSLLVNNEPLWEEKQE
ncbi:MAG: PrsW family intramembrane metalloprotease [Bacteroidales bacterium]|nr:PrsW family intramembrane metalloprotease [Bacteroidales bacterium]